jgi:uncharacterized membrane protein
MLVHFPIALIAIGFLAEFISRFTKIEPYFSKLSFYLLLAGTAFAVTTWLSGVLFTSEMSGTAGQIKETHEIFAGLSLGFLVVTCCLYLLQARYTGNRLLSRLTFPAYALSAVSIAITGFYGGTLVYNYMMPL